MNDYLIAILFFVLGFILRGITSKKSKKETGPKSSKDKADERFWNRYNSGLRGKDLTDGLYTNL
jgi:hypothetical protein